MKALVLDRPGEPKTLRLANIPDPQPAPDQVRVQVHAVGLNPVDYKLAASGFSRWTYPFILGLDVSGTVEAYGSNVTNWKVGDAVYYHGDLSKPGGYAEYTVVPAHVLTPVPTNVSFTEAAALPCAGFTAYQALYRKLHIQAHQTILIHGGAGGVGGFAVQLAALSGLYVIATCSPSNFNYVRRLGAAEVLDYNTKDLVSRVQELSQGRGVDFIVDTVSSETASAGLDMLAFGGGIACINGLPDFTKIKPFEKAPSIHEVALGAAYLSGDRTAQEDLARMGRELGALVSDRKVDSMLQEVINLEKIPDALVRLSERHVRGKIVAQIQL